MEEDTGGGGGPVWSRPARTKARRRRRRDSGPLGHQQGPQSHRHGPQSPQHGPQSHQQGLKSHHHQHGLHSHREEPLGHRQNLQSSGCSRVEGGRLKGSNPGLLLLLLYPLLASCLLFHCATATRDTASENQNFPISELCRGSRPQTRVIVGSLITSQAERELNCEVTFQTDTILQKFMLRFEKLELDCNDHLWIYDSAYSTGTPLKDLSCRDTLQNVATIYTHSNHVTLKYMTDEWGPITNGFKLIITAFKHKKNACRDFRCQTTNFCISTTLACDSVNHCGDGSDESNALASCPSPPLGELLSLSVGVLSAVGGILGGGLVLVAVVITAVVCVRSRRQREAVMLQRQRMSQQQGDYQVGGMGDQYGTNGTYGTVLAEKPPPYPGLPHHTHLGNQDSSPGNLRRPALADLVRLRPWVEAAALPLLLRLR